MLFGCQSGPNADRDNRNFLQTSILNFSSVTSFCWTFAFVLLFVSISSATAQTNKEDPQEAIFMAKTANNAQQADEFQLAAKQWVELLSKHPETSLTGLANYSAGYCYQELTNYPEAIKHFKRALQTLRKDEEVKITQSYLFLGFSQLRHGKDLLGDPNRKEEAQSFLTTAAQTLSNLAERHPTFVDLDQAYFFQGEAFDLLGRLDKASESYAKMIACPGRAFRFEGIFEAANVAERLGRYEIALKYYQQFLVELGAENHDYLSEVKYRMGETYLRLATGAQNVGDAKMAKESFTSADQYYAKAASDNGFDLRDHAIFQQAYCANRLQNYERAAKLYSQVASIKNSQYAQRSLVYAGREYLNANQVDLAKQTLTNAVNSNNSFSPEAAHWLAQIHLQAGENQQAFDIANAWIAKTQKTNANLVPLMLDRGDAAYAIPDRRVESIKLYQQIVETAPDHPFAPTALYNAAFSMLDAGQHAAAIQAVDQFVAKYATSEYLPDALEVKADASLLSSEFDLAETTFSRLIKDYGNSPKMDVWNVRMGMTKFLREDYPAAIAWLSPRAAQLNSKSQQAEALHWIGSSHLELKQGTEAVAALQQSVDIDPKWRRADETLLLLARAQSAINDTKAAQATSQRLLADFPKTEFADQAYLMLGEIAYSEGAFESAEKQYQAVVEKFAKSEFVPSALEGLGWSQVQQQKFKPAIQSFNQLIDRFPKNELAQRALVGRGASLRQTGDVEAALKDLNAFLLTKPEGKAELDALYELGIAQVDAQRWKAAGATFAGLIDKAPNSPQADRYHYELAWSYKKTEQEDRALKQFATLAETFPTSSLSAEANFHIGNAHFDASEFAAAIKAYEKSSAVESASASLREKATHQLGRAHFKLKDYNNALKQFKTQLQQFPQGEFLADGQLMVSESLMRLKQYDQAFEAYRVAKPAIEKSKPENRFLSLLHGGQSANQIKKYQEAIEFVQPIIDSDGADPSFKHDAWLEIGNAYNGLRDRDKAREAWSKATASLGKTGAHARCMLGDLLFAEKQFDKAITEYKKVIYASFSNPDDVSGWKAYALYEAARCNYVRVSEETDPVVKQKLAAEATKFFNELINKFPQDRHVDAAREAVKNLKKVAAN